MTTETIIIGRVYVFGCYGWLDGIVVTVVRKSSEIVYFTHPFRGKIVDGSATVDYFKRNATLVNPCAGVVCQPVCVGVDRYATVCKDGKCVRGALKEKNSPVCGYVKPVCTEGDKRSPETCWNGAIIHKEVCSGNKWVPTGAICPTKPKPECTDGDKRPGEICSGGKWVEVEEENGNGNGNGAEPGDSKYLTVAEADERVRMGLACYIKCVLPLLDLLPGIPYTPGAWVPPLCAITREA